MVEIIADITQNSKLDASAVNREKDVILREMEEVNKDIVEMIFDQLHARKMGCADLDQVNRSATPSLDQRSISVA